MPFGDFQPAQAPGAPHLTATIPVLPSRDIARTMALYERLGFRCVVASPQRDYLIARQAWVELHFWHQSDLDPATNAVSAYIRVHDADAATAAFATAASALPGCRYRPPADKAWGMRELHFIDHDGNLITVGAPQDARSWPPT